MEFYNKVAATVAKYEMLRSGDRVLAAVSGGPDSTAMLYALVYLAREFEFQLAVFHLNHMIRKEAAADAEHVRRLALQLGLEAHMESADVKVFSTERRFSPQEGARIIRYKLLEETAAAKGMNKIAVGHTADDVCETFIMRVIKGSGLTGLSSIPPVRDGRIIRPLIETERGEVMRFLAQSGIDYLIDPSNLLPDYFRNRVRLEVVPRMVALNPRFVKTVMAMVAVIREEDQALARETDRFFSRAAKMGKACIALSLDTLAAAGPAISRRMFRKALAKLRGDLRGVELRHLEQIWHTVTGSAGATDLPGSIRAEREGSELVIYKSPVPPVVSTRIEPGGKYHLDGLSVSVTIATKNKVSLTPKAAPGSPQSGFCFVGWQTVYFDAEAVNWPILVRSAAPGDRFMPLGLKGHKKIQDFFVDLKVPRRLRQSIPVLDDGEKIVAVGSRIDERVRVGKDTRRVAVVKFTLDE